MADLPWEDALVERKLESDLKDLLKTLVGFANSVKPGHVATILIGENDDSSVQGVTNPDNIQKSIRKETEKIYPPISWRSQVYETDGKHCVRVEIEYVGETPHFGGVAWIRKGSETIKASDELFQRLIEFRQSKVREIALWLEKEITVEGDTEGMIIDGRKYYDHPRWRRQSPAILRFVNSFWATFEVLGFDGQIRTSEMRSEPLEKLILTWDDRKNRLRVLVKV